MVSGSTGQKASGETIFQDGTTTWNIADGFTKINVLKILIEINLYETMAKFGKQNLEDPTPPHEIPYMRVDGFDRLIFSLRQIITNCMFQIEREDKEKIKKLVERIDLVESFSDAIANSVTNDVTKETVLRINEDHFRKCLDILSEIKEELHTLLNHAGLIFRKSDETDLEDFMETIYSGG